MHWFGSTTGNDYEDVDDGTIETIHTALVVVCSDNGRNSCNFVVFCQYVQPRYSHTYTWRILYATVKGIALTIRISGETKETRTNQPTKKKEEMPKRSIWFDDDDDYYYRSCLDSILFFHALHCGH